MKQFNKQEYQKRALAISKLAIYLETRRDPIMKILSELVSPIGEDIHPYRLDDNGALGLVERELKKYENGDEDEE